MAELGVEWGNAEQTILLGTATTAVDGVRELLEAIGANDMTLHVPNFDYVFKRSPYGANALNVESEPRFVEDHDALTDDDTAPTAAAAAKAAAADVATPKIYACCDG